MIQRMNPGEKTKVLYHDKEFVPSEMKDPEGLIRSVLKKEKEEHVDYSDSDEEEVWDEEFSRNVLELKNELIKEAIDETRNLEATFSAVEYIPKKWCDSSIEDLYDYFRKHLEGMTKEDWEEALQKQSNLKK